MASASPVYQSLDPTLKHIRVLELLPGTFESDLRGNLRTVTLDDKPSYTALSYTWGARTEGRTLKIRPDSKRTSKSIELPIADNLFMALRRLRRPLKTRILWVDVVCINQEDIDERSAQVVLMEEIYSNAESTAIWLGDTGGKSIYNDELTTSQRLLQSVSSMFRNNIVLRRLWDADCIPMDHAIQTTTPSWKDRGWVVQEYALSQRPYFQFGSRTRIIDKTDRLLGLQALVMPYTGSVLQEQITDFPGICSLAERLYGFYHIRDTLELGKKMSLYHAVIATKGSETTDPRDKIYSLLSFLNPRERELVSPDYHSSIEVVFSRATYAAFQGPTKFAILELIKFNRPGRSSALPTWSYDFRTSDPSPRHIQFGKITEMEVPSLQMNQECTELRFEGVCCDVVTKLTLEIPRSRSICYIHHSHGISTEGCVVSETWQKAVELLGLAEKFFRRNEATVFLNISDGFNVGADNQRQGFIYNTTFAQAIVEVVSSLFTNWESITTHLGIPLASHNFYSSQKADTEIDDIYRSLSYCNQASDSTTVLITTSGNIGVAPGAIQGGDRLVLPLCKTASGEFEAKVTPFEQPLALILREREDDKWTFHGLVRMERFGNKAQYMQNSTTYTMR